MTHDAFEPTAEEIELERLEAHATLRDFYPCTAKRTHHTEECTAIATLVARRVKEEREACAEIAWDIAAEDAEENEDVSLGAEKVAMAIELRQRGSR